MQRPPGPGPRPDWGPRGPPHHMQQPQPQYGPPQHQMPHQMPPPHAVSIKILRLSLLYDKKMNTYLNDLIQIFLCYFFYPPYVHNASIKLLAVTCLIVTVKFNLMKLK